MAKAPSKSTASASKTKKPRGAAVAAAAKTSAKSTKSAQAGAKAASKSVSKSTRAKVEGVGQSMTQAKASVVSPEDRRRMIQDAAYYLAEKDGFQHGREHHYWSTAEQQIDQLIQQSTVVATGNQQFDAVDTTNDIH